MKKLSESQSDKIKKALDNHKYYKNVYFWTSPSSAWSKRRQEKRDSFGIEFKHRGKKYRYESSVNCSCRNIYYQGRFSIDGVRTTVRPFNQLAGA